MSSLALISFFLVTAAPSPQPTAAVVVTRRAQMTDFESTDLSRRISDGLKRTGIIVPLDPDTALTKMPTLKITDKTFCDGRRECISNLGVLLGVRAVVSIEIGKIGQTLAIHLEAIETDSKARLAQADMTGPANEVLNGVPSFAKALAKSLGIVEAPPTPPPPLDKPFPILPQKSSRPLAQTLGFVLDGTGGALLVGGVVCGVFALSSYNEANRLAQRGDASYENAKRRSSNWMNAADVLYGVGAAALATGILLSVFGGTSDKPVTVAPAGAGVMVSGHF